MDLQVTFGGSRHVCPACAAAAQPFHDRLARSWRDLDFFQYEAYLHVEVPRVTCSGCWKVTQIPSLSSDHRKPDGWPRESRGPWRCSADGVGRPRR
ncbi:MAG TPA: hypothetical protein DIT03_09105 [Candidatus Accumulibacter sp.]|nr:hypothetical protein [Accumulibacter sp.]HCN68409.1 hypothetical protein [Accumulibacter sp.]